LVRLALPRVAQPFMAPKGFWSIKWCLPSSTPFVVEESNHQKEEFHPPNNSRISTGDEFTKVLAKGSYW
jgi:hypothetical protein